MNISYSFLAMLENPVMFVSGPEPQPNCGFQWLKKCLCGEPALLMCHSCTFALPTGNLSKHLGFTIYIDLPYPQGLNVGSSIITATWRKITNQPAGCWESMFEKSPIITVGLLLCGCLQHAGLLHKLASSTLDQCQKRCNNGPSDGQYLS